ncbi:MAG: hypothetical protein J6W00_00210 [Lentisphaeria bacterium]|nr:hypothetical protein [Lentisphaeria bacterium]
MMNKISESAIHKELDLIQGCISRMAHNSFIVKGWAVLLVSGVFAFWGKQALSFTMGIIVCGALLALWILNAFFLAKEKDYRNWYSQIIINRKSGNDELLYELNTTKYPIEKCCVAGTMFSTILPWFYLVLIVTTLSVIICSSMSDKNIEKINCNCTTMKDAGSPK